MGSESIIPTLTIQVSLDPWRCCSWPILLKNSVLSSAALFLPNFRAREMCRIQGWSLVRKNRKHHLLGLNHTDDDLDLMDDASPTDAFIEDQEFMEAPLSPDIMSIGSQDGVLLLSEIVGLRHGVTLKGAELVLRERRGMDVRRDQASFGSPLASDLYEAVSHYRSDHTPPLLV